MNCPNCNTEMIEGVLNNGLYWTNKKLHFNPKWTKRFSMGYVNYIVKAFRCPQCNKIELVAAPIN